MADEIETSVFVTATEVATELVLHPIPAGTFFTATSGEYSDYSVSGVFRALLLLNPGELRDAYLAEHPEQKGLYQFRESEFLAWLIRKDLIEAIPCMEWHLCDYRDINEMQVYDLL